MVACWEWPRLPFSLGLPFSLCGLRSLHRSIFCGSGRLLTPSALSCFSTFGAISTVIFGYFITIWSQWWPAPAPSKWPSGLLPKTWGLWLDMTCERTFPHLHWFATWITIALHHSHLFNAEARVDSHCFALRSACFAHFWSLFQARKQLLRGLERSGNRNHRSLTVDPVPGIYPGRSRWKTVVRFPLVFLWLSQVRWTWPHLYVAQRDDL